MVLIIATKTCYFVVLCGILYTIPTFVFMIYLPTLGTSSSTYLIIKHYLPPIYQCFKKKCQRKVDGYNLFMVGCKGGIFFLVLANPIGYAKTICFSKWLQLLSLCSWPCGKKPCRDLCSCCYKCFHVTIYGAIRFNTRSNMGQQKH